MKCILHEQKVFWYKTKRFSIKSFHKKYIAAIYIVDMLFSLVQSAISAIIQVLRHVYYE